MKTKQRRTPDHTNGLRQAAAGDPVDGHRAAEPRVARVPLHVVPTRQSADPAQLPWLDGPGEDRRAVLSFPGTIQ